MYEIPVHRRVKTYPALARCCSLLTLAVLTACQPSQSTSTATPTGAETPPHEQVLALLRVDDAVMPQRPDLHPVTAMYNRESVIPPMCYTRTEGRHNPCYVCHQDPLPGRENTLGDRDLQEAYSFSDLGLTNHWKNAFIDRTAQIAAISDADILAWVSQDNYSELAPRLRDAEFAGWIPDLAELQEGAAAFDNQGFARDGSGWVAFNYKPFPSTFWPTNGSTDDVMIRLDTPYRSDAAGNPSREIYKANLAIVEATIKGVDRIGSLPIDETAVGVDLDLDGKLGIATEVRATERYVGAAAPYFIDRFLYPESTEFLHTVRYLGITDGGDITPSRRMKEVRYMKKIKTIPKYALAEYYREEGYEKDAGYLPGYANLGDYGLDNGMGWAIQGFIENKSGRLRVAAYEENFFCMGCHNSVGATIDKTFSFARKMDGAPGWRYIDYKGMPDAPNVGDSAGEIATYFARAGGGDEFRSNPEMLARWFHADGSVNNTALAGKDVYQLITPSRERALLLNKAYKTIVAEQRFIFGRDAVVKPLHNVYDAVDSDNAPTLPPAQQYDWDIRLNWSALPKNP